MVFNGVWFNEAWAKTKTMKQFVDNHKHGTLSEEQLKEAWRLMNPEKVKSGNNQGSVQTSEELQPEQGD